jgi:hypothetical protein
LSSSYHILSTCSCSKSNLLVKFTQLLWYVIIPPPLESLVFLLTCLLLLSGDVQINPGTGGTSNIANENMLSIFHCNIRSLRNKLNYIADIIEEFDIMLFTETHLVSSIISKLNEITEYVDLNLVNAVLHKGCTYTVKPAYITNHCK